MYSFYIYLSDTRSHVREALVHLYEPSSSAARTVACLILIFEIVLFLFFADWLVLFLFFGFAPRPACVPTFFFHSYIVCTTRIRPNASNTNIASIRLYVHTSPHRESFPFFCIFFPLMRILPNAKITNIACWVLLYLSIDLSIYRKIKRREKKTVRILLVLVLLLLKQSESACFYLFTRAFTFLDVVTYKSIWGGFP